MKSEHWERVAALFDEATKLGPAEREDLLSTLADDSLRNELRSLLDAHEGRGAFDAVSYTHLRAHETKTRISVCGVWV